jgi:hypothetical protein
VEYVERLLLGVLGVPASELRDITADAADVFGREVTASWLEALASGQDAHTVLVRAIEQRGAREPHQRCGRLRPEDAPARAALPAAPSLSPVRFLKDRTPTAA